MERQSGKTPAALIAAGELPEDAVHVWQWFCQLSAQRQSGMGPNPISEESIGWFFRNRGILPRQWEIRAICALDNAWLNAQTDKQGRNQ